MRTCGLVFLPYLLARCATSAAPRRKSRRLAEFGTERAGVEPKISEYLAISRTHGEKGAIWEFSLVDPKGKTNPGPPDGTYEARPSARLFLGLLEAHARRRGPV